MNKSKIKFNHDEGINKDALLDLDEGISLGAPIRISRDELYETNRY